MDLATTNNLGLLLLGLIAGLISVGYPGPVTLTVLEVGAASGRRRAMQASFGAFGADACLMPIAIVFAAAGTALPTAMFVGLQVLSAAMLLLIGLALLVRPTSIHAVAGGLQNPGKTVFLFTVLSPSTIGAWVAMLVVMPFAGDLSKLGWYCAGILVASAAVNAGLGYAGGAIGPRLSPRRRTQLSRVGGVAMLCFAGLAVVAL